MRGIEMAHTWDGRVRGLHTDDQEEPPKYRAKRSAERGLPVRIVIEFERSRGLPRFLQSLRTALGQAMEPYAVALAAGLSILPNSKRSRANTARKARYEPVKSTKKPCQASIWSAGAAGRNWTTGKQRILDYSGGRS